LDACPPEDVIQISERMKKLKDLWGDTKDRAQKRKVGYHRNSFMMLIRMFGGLCYYDSKCK